MPPRSFQGATVTIQRRPTLWRNAQHIPDAESIKQDFIRHIQSSLGRDEYSATDLDRFQSLCLTVRDCLVERWVNTQQTYYQTDAKRIYYLSLEFLMGRALHNAMVNLGLLDEYRKAIQELGGSLEEMEELEVDAGLGNGGLGRLAACFLDSMATLALPAYGYGLRYDFGIFRQEILNGRQLEEPDDWLQFPHPWEIARPEYVLQVRFGGRVEPFQDATGAPRYRWVDTQNVLAMAYDTPIPGYGNNTVNTLRLWRARATHDFDLDDFNAGDYVGAVEHKVLSENITRVLYPNDNFYLGQELRLKQQYFLVTATLQDAVRRHLVNHPSLDNLHERAVFQLNDTHPALAVAELMRLLIDVHHQGWDQAWSITSQCMAYTNHTLLPEALEKWPAELMGRLLPRHLMIVSEINRRFLDEVRGRFPGDEELVRRVSIYEEGDVKRVRMAHLAVVGASSVNGVAALHTELLKSRVLPDFHRIWPEKFNNKTNGVTQRRWLLSCNPELSSLISQRLGTAWVTDLDQLEKLKALAGDEEFLEAVGRAKAANKQRLAATMRWQHGFDAEPGAIFDIQVKRIHEYKRQLLNCLHIIHLYRELQRNPDAIKNPRTYLFGGKSAPGYFMAKLIIKLINDVASTVNGDPQVSEKLRVFFVPNYSVSLAEIMIPGADISEQISTAGFEASGTGNMKFAMNGALTLGTLDGANVEIAEAVGADNIFIFGNTVDDVTALRKRGYNPRHLLETDPRIKEVIELIAGDYFNPTERGIYRPIVDSLLGSDHYLLLADFEHYRQAHLRVDAAYSDRLGWLRKALFNIASMGRFSSDRTIRDYVRDIWHLEPRQVRVE
jgi:starch phosphorylase